MGWLGRWMDGQSGGWADEWMSEWLGGSVAGWLAGWTPWEPLWQDGNPIQRSLYGVNERMKLRHMVVVFCPFSVLFALPETKGSE